MYPKTLNVTISSEKNYWFIDSEELSKIPGIQIRKNNSKKHPKPKYIINHDVMVGAANNGCEKAKIQFVKADTLKSTYLRVVHSKFGIKNPDKKLYFDQRELYDEIGIGPCKKLYKVQAKHLEHGIYEVELNNDNHEKFGYKWN